MLGDHGAEGLQIKAVDGGETDGKDVHDGWMDIVVPAHGTIVNTGALMARWTNDEWKATAHRVIVKNEEQANRDRYSIACFVDPDAQTVVQVHEQFCLKAKKKYDDISSLDYLMMKLKAAQST